MRLAVDVSGPVTTNAKGNTSHLVAHLNLSIGTTTKDDALERLGALQGVRRVDVSRSVVYVESADLVPGVAAAADALEF